MEPKERHFGNPLSDSSHELVQSSIESGSGDLCDIEMDAFDDKTDVTVKHDVSLEPGKAYRIIIVILYNLLGLAQI